MLKRFPLDKKMPSVFYRELQLSFAFSLSHSYMSSSTRLVSLNFFQNDDNRKTTYRFTPGAMIFQLQQESLKFNDLCVSWSYSKTI